MIQATPSQELGDRFGFGRNWKEFIEKNFSPARLEQSQQHLLRFLGLDSLEDRTFLDIGCGSGLHSLAAYRSGAKRIVSFDYDPDSVATTQWIREREGSPEHWTVQRGDALDADFMRTLPPSDIVYSWGVLHHTGDMWKAIRNAGIPMKPDSVFYIALYTHDVYQDPTPEYWLDLKQRYNRAGVIGKRLMEALYIWRFTIRPHLARRENPLEAIQEYGERGMSYYTDVKDWLGGWPMEFAKIKDVKRFGARDMGLELLNMWAGEGNTEYLFRPEGASNYWDDVLAQAPPIRVEGPFEKVGELGWRAPLPAGLQSNPDTEQEPRSSTAMLFENGVPLGFGHALPEHITAIGRGRFRHEPEGLLFSTLDDSDPGKNGREYTLREGLL